MYIIMCIDSHFAYWVLGYLGTMQNVNKPFMC